MAGKSKKRTTHPGLDKPYPPQSEPTSRVAESILTSKGRVTIPQALRAKYQLDAGDSLVWREDAAGRLQVEPRRSLTLADIRAAAAAAGAPVPVRSATLPDMEKAIEEAIVERHAV